MCDCLNCTDIDVPVGPQGATGPQGRAGADGTDGVAVLYNNYGETSTSSNGSWETLDTYQIGAASMTGDGDMLEIETSFTQSSWTSALQNVRITFGGNVINPYGMYGIFPILASFYSDVVGKIVLISKLTRTSYTTAKIESTIKFVADDNFDILVEKECPIQSLAALNFTTTPYDIDVDGYSVVNGDITNNYLRVIKNKIV